MQLSFADARPRRGLILSVLPDAARVEERLNGLARQRGLVPGKVACSLADLERELVREARRAGKCPAAAPPYAVELAVTQAAAELTPRASAFFAIRAQPGFAQALGELFSALGQGLLEPVELLDLPLPDHVRERVGPLARLLAGARARLDRAQVVEPARALRLTLDAVDGGLPLPPMLAQAAELQLDAILDWTPLRLRLASSLSRRMTVRVRLPFPPGRAELTEALDPVLRAFEKLGEGPAPELELFDPEAGPLQPFLHALFAPGEKAGVDQPVRLVSCASPAAQAREVARTCRDLIDGGAQADDLAVAARSLGGGVAEEIAAALDALGVPWRERRGRAALAAAPVRLALSVLSLVERDVPREGLVELLSSRLVWLREDGERLPAHVLAAVLEQAHARDEKSQGGYAARLDAYEARLRARGASAHSVAEVVETRARVVRALAALRSLPQRASLRDHAAALLGLLRRFGLSRHLRAPVPDDAFARAAAAALARDQAGARVLEETCAALARAAQAVGLGDHVFDRDSFRQQLSAALSAATLPPGGARGGAVQLLELRELHGRPFAHVLVAGLVDGELPARPAPDPLLSDDDRRAVNAAARRTVFRGGSDGRDAGLPSRQADEPLLFHLSLCAARTSAALFWPRADARGREIVRSPFADEACRALGRGPEEPAISPIPLAAACRSPSEWLARGALDAFSEPAYRVSPPPQPAAARALLAALSQGPLRGRLARVARVAQVERERIRAFIREAPPGRFSGQISAHALPVLAPAFRFDAAAPLSAGQLEEHATCGFRTLAKRVLRVNPDAPPDDELGHRERGTLLHRCLERFFARLREENRLPLRCEARDYELLEETANATMDAFAVEEHVGHSALWELRRAEVLATLEALVEQELGADPVELEARFGFEGGWEPLRLRDGDDEICVRGAIDRVDRAGGKLVVLDYKSGRADSLRRRLKADTLLEPEFQLPVYAAVLLQRGHAAVDAGYVALTGAEHTPTLGEVLAKENVRLDQLLELDPARRAELRTLSPKPANLADAVFARVRQMRAGTFEVRPLSCDFCELKPACRLVALPTDPDENGGEVTRV